MADAGLLDKEVKIAELELKIQQLTTNMYADNHRKLQIQAETRRLEENTLRSAENIEELKKQLEVLRVK